VVVGHDRGSGALRCATPKLSPPVALRLRRGRQRVLTHSSSTASCQNRTSPRREDFIAKLREIIRQDDKEWVDKEVSLVARPRRTGS